LGLKLVTTDTKTPSPPRALGQHGLHLWQAVTSEFVIEDAGSVELLVSACQALDRAESCREQIDQVGEVIKTKTGIREHPLLKSELACRAFIARSIARLGLDVEATKAIGRPPQPLGWKGTS
jgi:hypothetical protein